MFVKRLPVAEGVSLHALVWDRETGDETGDGNVPFVLVHGLSSNCRTWEAVAARLHDAGHPVAAVDLRGHGKSDKPDDGYEFATLTSDLSTAIVALGPRFDRPVVAGQSTGGNLAVELGHRACDRVAALVGVDGGVLELQDQWPEWEDCESALAPPQFAGTPVSDYEAMVRREHPDWSDPGVAATLANLEVGDDGTVRPRLSRDRHLRILRALWEQRPSRLVPTLGAPLLLILAEDEDAYKREAAERAATSGADVDVEWLRGDHDLHIQQPDAVSDLLLRFAHRVA